MSVQIRRAVLDSDCTDLIELSRRHLAPNADRRRFDWLYFQNPFGSAHAWLAEDSTSGAAVGAAAAFPRKFLIDGTEKMGWVLGDFCLDEKYRALGPALRLQRACLECVEPPHEFCYDFPSDSMMAVYKRLGINQTGSLVRWAKPLRAEEKLESLTGSKTIAQGLGVIANAALANRGYKGRNSDCEISAHEGSFGEEFSALDRQLTVAGCIRTVRTAEYLNWRYLAHPDVEHESLTARRKGKLIGYVVIATHPKIARIVDLCSIEEPAVIARLLAGAVERLTAGSAATANMAVGDGHPWTAIFERAGFIRRESSPVVVAPKPGSPLSENDFQKNWYLMQGERDS
jgi:hypothetical protein